VRRCGKVNFCPNPKELQKALVAPNLADQISDRIGAETRVTVLGHIQRCGTASPLDRLVAGAFGVAAVNLIDDGKYDYMVTW
jgi:ATP-dependent phosphofructokinase / diphosphate-dependent phosphofructokinase